MTLAGLARDLFSAGARVEIETRALLEHTASEITDDARSRIAPEHHPHLPFYADSITYDVDSGPGFVTAEIGPDADLSQGRLGEILERGSADSSPVPHLAPALEDHLDGFAHGVGIIGGRAF
jgi:hypothetical protein